MDFNEKKRLENALIHEFSLSGFYHKGTPQFSLSYNFYNGNKGISCLEDFPFPNLEILHEAEDVAYCVYKIIERCLPSDQKLFSFILLLAVDENEECYLADFDIENLNLVSR